MYESIFSSYHSYGWLRLDSSAFGGNQSKSKFKTVEKETLYHAIISFSRSHDNSEIIKEMTLGKPMITYVLNRYGIKKKTITEKTWKII